MAETNSLPALDRVPAPRWVLFAPFLAALTQRQRRVLGLLAVALVFGQYDRAVFSLALPRIQAGLGIPESELGILGSIVRLGALPAFAITLLADRMGRRRTLLGTVIGGALLTGATAFARDAWSFVVLQFLATAFCTALVVLAVVVLSEELDAESRGWGVGALFGLQSLGVALAVVLLPGLDVAPGARRALFAVGLAPLFLVPWWRRNLEETGRFAAHQRALGSPDAPGRDHVLAPVAGLLRDYPGRLGAVGAVVLLFAASGAAADFLGVKYLSDGHGWAPADVMLLYLGGGAVGILGTVCAGRLGDRLGRRRVTVLFGVVVTLATLGFYNASGPWLAPLWVASIFAVLGFEVLLATYGTELFPTSHRSTAAGARAMIATVGGAIGLAAESWLYAFTGSHWTAVSLLLGIAVLAPLTVALALPETAGRTLEEIAPERRSSP